MYWLIILWIYQTHVSYLTICYPINTYKTILIKPNRKKTKLTLAGFEPTAFNVHAIYVGHTLKNGGCASG